MTTRKYSSRSQQTTLSAPITSSATTMTVVSGSSLVVATVPNGQTFTVVIDPDTALEEIVDVTNWSSGNTLTIERGLDGSSGIAHSAGAVVKHMAIGRDYREANTHIEGNLAGHTATTSAELRGIISDETGTGSLVFGTSPTIATPTITSPTITGTGAIAGVFTGNLTGNVTGSSGSTTGNAATATALQTARNFQLTGDVEASAVSFNGTGAVSLTTVIGTGVIVNADVNASAAIDKTKISGTAITAADTGTVTSTMIADGAIVNADINTSAQIAYGKLNLNNTIHNDDVRADANIASTKIAGTAVTLADTGTVTSAMIANGTIVNADISDTAAIALSKLASDPLARANHTGTQTASTISNFDTQVRTSKVTDLAAPTGSFSMNSQKITSLATPTTGTDAATKAYADLMIPLAQKGVANGVAELDADGLVPAHHLPPLSITSTQVVSSQSAMLALTAQVGDVAVRTDVNKTFILTAAPASTLGNWQELLTPTDSVISVDGQTGAVSLSSTYATVANAANKLPLAGGTMSGAIAMGSNKITGLGTPSATDDAATKAYADGKLALTGGTLSGQINMGANKITNLADPTDLTDAMTLNYFNGAALAPSNLTGPITSIGPATAVASQTGTGSKFVMDNSPTLITPVLGVATATSINSTVIPSSKTLVATDSTDYVVPSQTGNTGKYLTTDGTTSSWGAVDAIPSQTGNTGKYLTTDGSSASWAVVTVDSTPTVFMLGGM